MGIASDTDRDDARRKARDMAREIIRSHSVSSPPVPLEEIIRAHSIEILRHRFDGPESGFALRDNDRWYIGVNTQTSRRRQRFTIAHELGHLLLHQGRPIIVDQAVLRVDLRNDISSMGTALQEIEANTFAAALLMPEPIVARYVTSLIEADGNIARDDLIAESARTFDVSTEAMGYRLINLGILTA